MDGLRKKHISHGARLFQVDYLIRHFSSQLYLSKTSPNRGFRLAKPCHFPIFSSAQVNLGVMPWYLLFQFKRIHLLVVGITNLINCLSQLLNGNKTHFSNSPSIWNTDPNLRLWFSQLSCIGEKLWDEARADHTNQKRALSQEDVFSEYWLSLQGCNAFSFWTWCLPPAFLVSTIWGKLQFHLNQYTLA